MKILLLTSHLNFGGISVYTVSLAEGLKNKGEEVLVSSGGGDLVPQLEENGIKHIKIPIDTKSEIGPKVLLSAFKLHKILREEKIDLIHAQTRVTQVVASNINRFLNIPYVTTCHGFFKARGSRLIFPCWGSKVVAISEAVREHLVNQLKVPKEKVSLIYNGIDTNKFFKDYTQEEKDNLRCQYQLSQGPVIGIISRLSSVKGHKYLLLAFAQVLKYNPSAQLLIIGDGAEKQRLIDLTKKLKIADKVIFGQSTADTTKPLSIMDIFVLPSLQEGLGLCLLEAMAMAKPVIASDVGGIYTLVQHRTNGLLTVPADESSLTQMIIALLNDREMAIKMGQAGRKMVEDKFSLEQMVEKTKNLYREVLNAS